MKIQHLILIGALLLAPTLALTKGGSPKAVKSPQGDDRFIAYNQPLIVFTHAEVIDGTGAGPKYDTNVLVVSGKIASIGAYVVFPKDSYPTVIDITGKTLLPGFVMMHEHLFYPLRGNNYGVMPYTFPRLYLAGGETTVRTAGSLSPYTDIALREEIAAGHELGPDLDSTGPYLTGRGLPIYDMHVLKSPQEAAETVNYWVDEGSTSFKVYMHITRANLKAVIDTAHARGIKVTGHLCSVTYREAAELGIDNLEHGFGAMTDFVKAKKADECPEDGDRALADVDPSSGKMKSLIRTLIDHRVALTSTLGVFESFAPGRPEASAAARDLLIPELRQDYETHWALIQKGGKYARDGIVFAKLMKLQKTFADQGGVLMMGSDPTGYGGVLPGYSSKREIELLVESGFTFPEAIKIATLNAAQYLGRDKDIGSIATGKRADLIVIEGDPMKDAAAIEHMPLVFKAGIGYDTAAILATMKGQVGLN